MLVKRAVADLGAYKPHLSGAVDLVQHQPGVVAAQVLCKLLGYLEASCQPCALLPAHTAQGGKGGEAGQGVRGYGSRATCAGAVDSQAL